MIVFRSWRDNPLRALTETIAAETQGNPKQKLDVLLDAGAERVGGELFIILDQFEEYFLYHPEEDGEGTFAIEFPRALNQPALRASFLLSMRDDCLAKLDRFKGRIPRLFDHYLRIEHLDRRAARAAIIRPLKQYNRIPGKDRAGIERALVKAILSEVEAQQLALHEEWRGVPGDGSPFQTSRRIEAPYLQLILQRLWDEELRSGSNVMRLETLERLGGAERIVLGHLDRAMAALEPRDQETAARVFHYLVTPSRTKVAYTAADLAGYTGLPQREMQLLLERLSAANMRILCPVAGPPDSGEDQRFEIYHDVLAGAILEYVQKREISQAREEADRERQRAEKEARMAVRLRWLSAAVVVLFAVALAIGSWAWYQRQMRFQQDQIVLQRKLENEQLRLRKVQLETQAAAKELEIEAARREKQGLSQQAASLRQQADHARRIAILAQGGGALPKPSSAQTNVEEAAPGRAITIFWSGSLEPNGELTIEGGQASTGQITQPLPGRPVHLEKVTPAAIAVLEAPSAANRWRRLKLRNGTRPTESIIITLRQNR